MPNGADYLPPGTTYADLDAHFGGPSRRRDWEDLTADEQRARQLDEPYHHGFCETCAEEAGELVPRLNCARRCQTCMEQDSPDLAAVEQMLQEFDRHGIDRFATATEVKRILKLVLPLLGSAKVADRASAILAVERGQRPECAPGWRYFERIKDDGSRRGTSQAVWMHESGATVERLNRGWWWMAVNHPDQVYHRGEMLRYGRADFALDGIAAAEQAMQDAGGGAK